jgi:hypothetical protein
MRRGAWAVAAAVALLSAPALGHQEKRTDPCGCHHQWGLRHCHPKKKTSRCEAPASKKDEPRAPERSPAPAPDDRAQDV